MRATCGFLLIPAAPLSAAPVPKELRAGDEMRIVGVWHLKVSKIGDGDYTNAIGTKWTLGADGKAIRDRPNEGIGKADFKIDPKSPVKSFDWITEEGNTFLGVYELDGDTFRVALSTGARPAACKPSDGGYYFEFRRIK
jgi:uncharacterized protein (TIGR03067 family)